jgi:hypothetical protein
MPKRVNDPPEYVVKTDCLRQHGKIDLALFGPDGRGGMVKDMTDIKNFMSDQTQNNTEQKTETRTKKHDYRSFIFAIVGGIIVAVLNFFLR